MLDVQDLITRFERLRADRAVWDSHWQETAERVLPRAAEFTARSQKGPSEARRSSIPPRSSLLNVLHLRWKAC